MFVGRNNGEKQFGLRSSCGFHSLESPERDVRQPDGAPPPIANQNLQCRYFNTTIIGTLPVSLSRLFHLQTSGLGLEAVYY